MGTISIVSKFDDAGFVVHASSPDTWLGAAQINLRAAKRLGQVAIEDYENRLRDVQALIDACEAEGTRLRANRPPVQPDFDGPTFFLFALAIENLLKEIIVSNEPQLVRDGKLHRFLDGHNLVTLAQRARVPIDDGERLTFQALTNCTRSWGRYSLGANVQNMPQGVSYELADATPRLARVCERLARRLSWES